MILRHSNENPKACQLTGFSHGSGFRMLDQSCPNYPYQKGVDPSFPRRRESRMPLKEAWIPAFAGMTKG
jgi:hypothetical protein